MPRVDVEVLAALRHAGIDILYIEIYGHQHSISALEFANWMYVRQTRLMEWDYEHAEEELKDRLNGSKDNQ